MPSSTSGGKVTCRLSMLLRSCANVVAPMMLLVTKARLLTKASAPCAGSMPWRRSGRHRDLEKRFDFFLAERGLSVRRKEVTDLVGVDVAFPLGIKSPECRHQYFRAIRVVFVALHQSDDHFLETVTPHEGLRFIAV